MKCSIKGIDCVGDGQQSKAPGDARVLPTTDSLGESLEDKLWTTTLAKHR